MRPGRVITQKNSKYKSRDLIKEKIVKNYKVAMGKRIEEKN